MEGFIIYIAKVSVGLALLTIIYLLLLREDRHFVARRIYLLLSMVVSLLFQLIPSPLPARIVEISGYAAPLYSMVEELPSEVVARNAVELIPTLLFVVWGAVAAVLFVRVIYALATIFAMRCRAIRRRDYGVDYLLTDNDISPFTLFGWIVLPRRDEANEEVLIHESAHCNGWHSFDMLFAELVVIVMWFNPFAWIARSEVRDNLEYIADRDVIDSGRDRRAYQHELLRLHCTTKEGIVATYFNHSQIKKRIIMMNSTKKSSLAVARYATLPMLVLALAMTNARATVVESANPQKVETATATTDKDTVAAADSMARLSVEAFINEEISDAIIILDNREISIEKFKALDPSTFASVAVLKDAKAVELYGERAKGGVILVERENTTTPAEEDFIFIKANLSTAIIILDNKEISVEELETLDPSTFASVVVLKDAKAVELYGERATGEVILIESKGK